MKRSELLKRMREIVGELPSPRRGKHDVYRIGSQSVSVPRHKEINELTAEAILDAVHAAIEADKEHPT